MHERTTSRAPQHGLPLRRRPLALLLVLHAALAIPLALSGSSPGPCPSPAEFESERSGPVIYSQSQECADVAVLGLFLGAVAAGETWIACRLAGVPRGKRAIGSAVTWVMAALLSHAALRMASPSGPLGPVEVVSLGWLTAGLVAVIGTAMVRAEPPPRHDMSAAPS